MSPISKMLMAGSLVTPFVVTELRVAVAMLLFRAASFFTKSEHVNARDLLSLFAAFLIAIAPPPSCGTRLVLRPTFRTRCSLLSKAPRPRAASQAFSCSFFSSFLLKRIVAKDTTPNISAPKVNIAGNR